jgi:hypothetical protein
LIPTIRSGRRPKIGEAPNDISCSPRPSRRDTAIANQGPRSSCILPSRERGTAGEGGVFHRLPNSFGHKVPSTNRRRTMEIRSESGDNASDRGCRIGEPSHGERFCDCLGCRRDDYVRGGARLVKPHSTATNLEAVPLASRIGPVSIGASLSVHVSAKAHCRLPELHSRCRSFVLPARQQANGSLDQSEFNGETTASQSGGRLLPLPKPGSRIDAGPDGRESPLARACSNRMGEVGCQI